MRAFSLVLVTALFASGCLWRGDAYDVVGDTRFTFLHTSDIHSRLFPFELAPNAGDRNLGLNEANAPFGGGARLAYIVKRERARAGRVLHLDSGDCFQGAPIFNRNLGEAEVRYLADIGVDAAVIGNHEFDAGVQNMVSQLGAWATFDVLAANYVFPDADDPSAHSLGRIAQPYSIYNVGGVKVAVIGMANLGSLTSIGEGGNSLQITPLEQNEIVRHYVEFLHPQVDLITIVSHLGLTEDQELIEGYEKAVLESQVAPGWEIVERYGDGRVLVKIPGVRNIDAILGGHLHIVLNPPKRLTDPDGREVILTHPGAFSKFLARLDVVLKSDDERGGKRIVSHKYQVFPVDQRLAGYEDEQVTEMLEPYLVDMVRSLDLRRVIAYVPKTVTRFSVTGNGDSGLGNIVADSMRTRRRVDAEFAVTNTLGIRDNFYRGPLTLEDMFNVFPFENTLTVMYLSGREVQELVNFITERSASRGCNAQAQVAGIRFAMNCGQVLANERNPNDFVSPGEDILINGRPLDANSVYKVATNDYIAGGGSGFRVLKRNTTKVNTGVSLRDALIDYLQQLPLCGEYEKNIGKHCERPDAFSQKVCGEIGYADRIAEYMGQEGVEGAYAKVPCVIGVEDGRIKRLTAENLDQLPDYEDMPEVQP